MNKLDKKEYLKQWRAANPDKVAAGIARSSAKRRENWDAFLESERQRYARSKDVVADRQRKRIEADPASRAEIVSRSYQKNKPRYVARVAKRRAAKLNATPPWVDMDAIAAFYELARRLTEDTGIPHEVDHIVPLRGKVVSGLHVPWNLRVIPRRENRAKGRKFDDNQSAPQLEPATVPAADVGLFGEGRETSDRVMASSGR